MHIQYKTIAIRHTTNITMEKYTMRKSTLLLEKYRHFLVCEVRKYAGHAAIKFPLPALHQTYGIVMHLSFIVGQFT